MGGVGGGGGGGWLSESRGRRVNVRPVSAASVNAAADGDASRRQHSNIYLPFRNTLYKGV